MTVIKTTTSSVNQSALEKGIPGSASSAPGVVADGAADRPVWLSVKRGWKQACPACARGRMYTSYLKVNDACPSCKEELHHQRADDAPPYFTISIVAHIIVFGILLSEQHLAPPVWLQLAIWLPLTAALCLWFLPRVKGALIGYQWANRMHGFGDGAFEGADIAPADPLPVTTP
ncbi:MAG: DUF983 domain-containing protein [Hyphomicrobium sp.]|nr:DUF983 domain-containing protein [Hyphomicrobium sp.]